MKHLRLLFLVTILGASCSDDQPGPDRDAGSSDLGGDRDAGADVVPDADVLPDADVVEDPAIDLGGDAADVVDDVDPRQDAASTDVEDDGPAIDAGADALDGGFASDLVDVFDVGAADSGDAFSGDLGADTGGPDTGAEIVCRTLTPPATGTCEVTPGDQRLLIRGTVLAGDVLIGGEVLIGSDGLIACVGCNCGGAGATLVECAEGVVSPGLINAHDHIGWLGNAPGEWGDERFDHRHDWGRGYRGHTDVETSGPQGADVRIWGEMRQVMAGTTSIFASGSSDGFLRNLDIPDGREGLTGDFPDYDTFPLGGSDRRLKTADCDFPDIPSPSATEMPYAPHVAEGIDPEARNELLCLSSTARGGVDVADGNSAFIHMISTRANDGAMLAAGGTSIIWSARTNVSLYGHTAPVTMLATQGVNIGLGTDWPPSGSATMLRELACVDSLNQTYYDGYFADRDIWLMTTENNARALGVDDQTGLIRRGLAGDIAIFARGAAPNPYRAIIEADDADVVLVLRGGEVLYGDDAVVLALPSGGVGCDPIDFQGGDVCGVAKRICSRREVDQELASLVSNAGAYYGLFFCGVPTGEPACAPVRVGEYAGVVPGTDDDGDGVDNGVDNCPAIFNPPRPVDRYVQADFDGDDEGDVCDPCPLDPDSTDCSSYDPADRDNDGFDDAEDNCPDDHNPGQSDGEGDGIGDACDVCPGESNLGGAPCTLDIYAFKTSRVPVDTELTARGIVTQVVEDDFFFMQVPAPDRDGELGADYSGTIVFMNNNPAGLTIPARGDLVEVTGAAQNFFNTLEMTEIADVAVISSGNPMPDPITMTTIEAPYGSERARQLDGLLIEVAGQVTRGFDDRDTLVLDDQLIIDPEFFRVDPEPLVGDDLLVRGILRLRFDATRIFPRDALDIAVTGDPRLLSVEPTLAFLEVGDTNLETVPPIVVTLNRPAPEGGTTLAIANSDVDESVLDLPDELVVPEGDQQVTLTATGVSAANDPVELTISLDEVDLTTAIRVVPAERDPQVAAITPEASALAVGFTTTLRLVLDVPADEDAITFDITAEPASAVTITGPGPVGAWDTYAEIEVEAVEAAEVTITAAVTGSAVEATAMIDVVATPPTVLLSEVMYNPAPGNDGGLEWVEIYNPGASPIDLSTWTLGAGGSDYTTTLVPLSGTIEGGGCLVVGGPGSGDTNGNPIIDIPLDLSEGRDSGGIQNGGSASDGVALFNVPEDDVSDQTVPSDAVIYDGSNSNALPDEHSTLEGGELTAGAVDVDGAPNAGSLVAVGREEQGTLWDRLGDPAPNDCAGLSE